MAFVRHALLKMMGCRASAPPLLQANDLIVLHHSQGEVVVGDSVDVMIFDGVI